MSRALPAAFAEVVRAAGLGPDADLGCGPGKVTAHPAGLGVSAFGVDLAPKMIVQARSAFPGLDFTVGSMTALPIQDNELGSCGGQRVSTSDTGVRRPPARTWSARRSR